jgi:hypothetical protein
MGFLILGLLLLTPMRAIAAGPESLVEVTAAFLTSLTVHEAGHALIADQMGADGIDVHFFRKLYATIGSLVKGPS